MRKTSVRKFIHLVIDILPLLIIPIFALNILHKETEPISIEVQEKVSVDFNQLINLSDTTTTISGVTFETNGISLKMYGTCTSSNNYIPMTLGLKKNHIYLMSNYPVSMPISSKGLNSFQLYGNNIINIGITENQTTNYVRGMANNNGVVQVRFRIENGSTYNLEYNPQIYDLTQMFGEGKEVSNTEFFNLFPYSYNYTESQKMLVNKQSPTIYNDTDIGSQFVYALYKPVHDYFNFNNLFNMGAIYNWIELNLFSGTAPLPIFIIWNVIVYEFFVDLIFLLYGIFMFIIDFAEKCLERPFRR